MNYKKVGKVLILFLISFTYLQADPLTVYFENVRTWDKDKNTNFDINYKIPLRNLSIAENESNNTINLLIEYSLSKNGKKVYEDSYKPVIPVSSKKEILNGNYEFSEKTSFTLSKDGFIFQIKITDENSTEFATWESDLSILNARVSDLEFSGKIFFSTDMDAKFYRSGYEYEPNPSHIFNSSITDTVYVFSQINSDSELSKVNLSVWNDDSGLDISKEVRKEKIGQNLYLLKIPSDIMDTGYNESTFSFIFEDDVKEKKESFIVNKNKIYVVTSRIFSKYEDERRLIQYFLKNKNQNLWNSLSEDAGWRKIDAFWRGMDPTPDTEENEFQDLVKERVRYADKQYKSRSLDGWKTDRGRLFIRNGAPSEILNGRTDRDNTPGNLDAQVWKYRSNIKSTYVFIDRSHDDRFDLIIADDDEYELTDPSFRTYFGIELEREYRMDVDDSGGWISTPGTFDNSIFD